jgi:hypothetical protein
MTKKLHYTSFIEGYCRFVKAAIPLNIMSPNAHSVSGRLLNVRNDFILQIARSTLILARAIDCNCLTCAGVICRRRLLKQMTSIKRKAIKMHCVTV